MRKAELNEISPKLYEYQLSPYNAEQGVKINKSLTYSKYWVKNGYMESNKLFYLENRLFMPVSGAGLYELTYSGAKYLSEPIMADNDPFMVSVRSNGNRSVMVMDKDMGVFIGSANNKEFAQPTPSACCTYKGELVYATNTAVYVRYDFDKLNGTFKEAPIFQTTYDDEHVVGVAEYKGGILVLLKNKMVELSLTVKPWDVVVKRAHLPYFSAREKSLIVIGDRALFIWADKLCAYKDSNLTFYDLPLGLTANSVLNGCGKYENLYLFQYDNNGEKGLFAFDCMENEFYQLNQPVTVVSQEGGFIFLEYDQQAYRLALTKTVISAPTQNGGVVTDLGVPEKKIIYKIKFFASGSATLKITGDFGEKTFDIAKKNNNIKCNLISGDFTFEFVNTSSDFSAEKLNVIFTKIGE